MGGHSATIESTGKVGSLLSDLQHWEMAPSSEALGCGLGYGYGNGYGYGYGYG